MKKLLYLCAVIALASCSSKSETEKMIEKYMDENSKVPGSYKPVSTTELDSAFNNPMVTAEYRAMDAVCDSLDEEWSKAVEDADFGLMDEIDAKRKSVRDAQDRYLETHPNGDFIGWSCDHQYIAKNAMGVEIRGTVHVLFNKEKTEIVSIKEKK